MSPSEAEEPERIRATDGVSLVGGKRGGVGQRARDIVDLVRPVGPEQDPVGTHHRDQVAQGARVVWV